MIFFVENKYCHQKFLGCLRHVDIVDTKDGDGGTGKITEQEWIEGSSLALD